LVLPLVVILLVAFRTNKTIARSEAETITISGLVVHAGDRAPVPEVSIRDAVSDRTATTDERGFFTIDIPANQFPVQTKISFTKDGFNKEVSAVTLKPKGTQSATGLIEIVGLLPSGLIQPNSKMVTISYIKTIPVYSSNTSIGIKPDYEAVVAHFEKEKQAWVTEDHLKLMAAGSEKPYWSLNGKTFIMSNGGWASTDAYTDVIYVDGKRMTPDDVNKNIRKSSIKSVSVLVNEAAKKKYGSDQPVFEIFVNTTMPGRDTVPPPPAVNRPVKANGAKVPEDDNAFQKRNPTVESLEWRNDSIYIRFKSGAIERYAANGADLVKAEKKYGKFPVAPPPAVVPPPPPAPPTVTPQVVDTIKSYSNTETEQLEFLRARIAQLNDSIQSNKGRNDLVALRAYLNTRSFLLQKEQETLQKSLQQKQ